MWLCALTYIFCTNPSFTIFVQTQLCGVLPEFGVIHIFRTLLDIVEGLFCQFFRRLQDQGFGCVG